MPANAIDLTTVAEVKAWLGSSVLPGWVQGTYPVNAQINDPAGHLQTVAAITGGGDTGVTEPTFNDAGGQTTDNQVTWQDGGISDDQLAQLCITAASKYWLWRTGRGPADNSLPTQSPLVQAVAYSEWYSGNGSFQMFLRQTPIVSVTALVINGQTVALSTAWNMPGYFIADDHKSLLLRANSGGSGTVLTNLYGAWSIGQLFAKGIANINVQYTAGYAGTPPDVEFACRQMVATNFKRKAWIDQKSQAMAGGAGTISFRDWEVEPAVRAVMTAYTSTALA